MMHEEIKKEWGTRKERMKGGGQRKNEWGTRK